MKRTQETLNEIRKILTDNEKAQEIMTMLAEKAEENNLTTEEWEKVKTSILCSCFFMIAQEDKKIRNDLAMDLYEELKE